MPPNTVLRPCRNTVYHQRIRILGILADPLALIGNIGANKFIGTLVDYGDICSEPNPDVVPAPQAQTSSSSPSSTPGDATASSPPQNPQDNIHLPPPPLPGHPAGAYQTVKRKGTASSEELEGNLATLGGRPRSVEGFPAELRGARRRRYIDDDSVRFVLFVIDECVSYQINIS